MKFKHAIYIQKIDIYETFHAGGVKKISAKKLNTQNTYEVIWQTKSVTDLKSSRIFSPNFKVVFLYFLKVHIIICENFSYQVIFKIDLSLNLFKD